MFLRKKEKIEIGTACNNIYDISLHITEKISSILSNYGYTLQVESHKNLFVAITSMYCYYFFEQALRKYYNYSDNKCFIVIDCLLKELASHLIGVTYEQTFGTYIDIKKILNNTPKNSLEEYVVVHYLIMAIEFDQDEIETKLLLDVYGEFHSIMKNIYKIV